jgi:ubiquinone/menaquinone biosynthesis C-methylase UbiE
LSLDHWESYYRSGVLATCPTTPAGGYDLEVRDAWVAFFTALPADARVLDIGTGNGAVALIAAETAAALGRNYRVHGTDLARIDPQRHVQDGEHRLAGIEFHAGVATEKLPFEDASFDAVSGHYALEYMRVDAALAEIHRVLRPAARACFIVHHSESLLVRNAGHSLRQADLVLNETRIYRLLRRFIEAERASRPAAHRYRQELNAAAWKLQQAADQPVSALVLSVTLDAIQKLLSARARLNGAALERAIDKVEADLRASVRRLRDLVACAKDDAGMARLEASAAAAGFSVIERVPQMHGGENLVGWRMTLRRA